LDVRVLCHPLLDLAGDQLLDPLGTRAGPDAIRDRLADLHVGVLALGHARVTVESPGNDGAQRHPRDMPVLGEVARGVLAGCNHRPIALVFVLHGITRTGSPSYNSLAPETTICSSP